MRVSQMLMALATLAVTVAAVPSLAEAKGDFGFELGGGVFARSLTMGPDGNLWFAAGNAQAIQQRIGRITAGGDVKEYSVPPPDSLNWSIAAGTDGNLWFTEQNAIGRITPVGEVTAFPLPSGATPTAVTRGTDGNVWFAARQPNTIGRISPAGEVTEIPVATASPPAAITTGPAGDLWFVEPKAGRIGRVTADGKLTEFPLPGERAEPDSIALGPDGNLWFGDEMNPRVGRITAAGEVTFFAVPTTSGTHSLISAPDGLLWFAAGNELGAISTAGVVRWPSCIVAACNFPPSALAIGPKGQLWVASGVGHCPGYCGGGSELVYLVRNGGLGPFALPPVTLGIGPRLAPLRHRHTGVLLGCGEASACSGVVRLQILIRPPNRRGWRLVSTTPYSLAAGESRLVSLALPWGSLSRFRYARSFFLVSAEQGGSTIDRRAFYFSRHQGGIAKR